MKELIELKELKKTLVMGDARLNEGHAQTEEKGRQYMGNKKSRKTTSM